MFLELTDNIILKDCFETVGKIIDEIILECDSEGMRLRALDRSHITFVEMDLKGSLFDEYKCEKPEKIVVDSTELTKILKRCNSKDILRLETDDSYLILKFEGDSSRTFKLALIDNEYESAVPPSIEHPVSVPIPTNILEEILKDMELFGETLSFTVDEDYLICNGTSELGDSETKYLHGEHVKEVVRSVFNIAKIKDMLTAKKLSKLVTLKLGNDMPLIMNFNISNGEGKLEFLLAPRLEMDE